MGFEWIELRRDFGFEGNLIIMVGAVRERKGFLYVKFEFFWRRGQRNNELQR